MLFSSTREVYGFREKEMNPGGCCSGRSSLSLSSVVISSCDAVCLYSRLCNPSGLREDRPVRCGGGLPSTWPRPWQGRPALSRARRTFPSHSVAPAMPAPAAFCSPIRSCTYDTDYRRRLQWPVRMKSERRDAVQQPLSVGI